MNVRCTLFLVLCSLLVFGSAVNAYGDFGDRPHAYPKLAEDGYYGLEGRTPKIQGKNCEFPDPMNPGETRTLPFICLVPPPDSILCADTMTIPNTDKQVLGFWFDRETCDYFDGSLTNYQDELFFRPEWQIIPPGDNLQSGYAASFCACMLPLF